MESISTETLLSTKVVAACFPLGCTKQSFWLDSLMPIHPIIWQDVTLLDSKGVNFKNKNLAIQCTPFLSVVFASCEVKHS